MDISLTPQELRDLLTPPLMRLRRPLEPLDLDALTRNGGVFQPAGARPFTDEEVADAEGLTAQRTLVVTLADLAQAKEELARTSTLVEEKAEELRQLIDNYGRIRQTPIMRANAVIENAGKQALDIARIFFLETGSDSWYQGVRATLKNLLDTLGVEVDEQLEEHLRPAEATLEEPAPLVEQTPPPFDTEEEMIRTLASDEPRPALELVPPAGSAAADVPGSDHPAGRDDGDDIEF